MQDADIHLAASAVSTATCAYFESSGFQEDIFRDCRNCAPTLYHATFRGSSERINDALWVVLANALAVDPAFNGILEQESVVQEYRDRSHVVTPTIPAPPLPIQACPANFQKACDVHIGVKLDPDGASALDWLEGLQIASFRKTRPDGEWRIFTATFDHLRAGDRFYGYIVKHTPRSQATTFKVKYEKIVRALRCPSDATTLPLTHERQLDAWLSSVGADEAAQDFHRIVG